MRTLFVLLLISLPLLTFAQCYQGYKKEGDRLNRRGIYEKAIKQYLAAFTCPDLEEQERNTLIKLIDGALQARVKQLEDANKKTQEALNRATKAEQEATQSLANLQEALQSILYNYLQSVEEDILNLNYEAALAKIKDTAQLKVDDEKVGLTMMELVYFFNESGQHKRAISLSDTLSNLLTIKDLAIQQDTLNTIRAYLSKANLERYQQLEARYYPIMIDIPGGTFEMGSSTTHPVKLSSYRLAKYETTNWQYHLFCMSTGRDSIERTREGWPLQGNLPVVNVSWYDGIQYSNWLNEQKEKDSPFQGVEMDEYRLDITKNSYRLPTEAEWEYAAQGGLAKKETVYSGSNNLDEVGWYRSNSNSRPHQVGALQPNRLGLYDMSGNTWEWCWDWYGDYETALVENPLGADSGTIIAFCVAAPGGTTLSIVVFPTATATSVLPKRQLRFSRCPGPVK